MNGTNTKTIGNDKVIEAGNNLYSIIVNFSAGSNFSYKDLKDLQVYLGKKISKHMIDDAMDTRAGINQKKFAKSHLTYITKEDISKENLESM